MSMDRPPENQPRRKPNNLRTGLILGALALLFFLSVFIKRIWLT
jgi:hypothetical protein